jgi:hypothetical protein
MRVLAGLRRKKRVVPARAKAQNRPETTTREAPMSFHFKGLQASLFEPLFALDDAALAARGIVRLVADEKPGFPCRVSLADAEVGERVLLLPHPHQPAHSPYNASGPIFVRENARETYDRAGALPEVLRNRLLSIRAYDARGMMVDADVAEGEAVEPLIAKFFAREAVDYLHVHYARRGCFSCRVERG